MRASYIPRENSYLSQLASKFISQIIPETIAEAVTAEFRKGERQFTYNEVESVATQFKQVIIPQITDADTLRNLITDEFFSLSAEYDIIIDYLKLLVFREKHHLIDNAESIHALILEMEHTRFAFIDEVKEIFLDVYALTEKIRQKTGRFPEYRANDIIVAVLKLPFALGEVAAIDDILWPILNRVKSDILNGSDDIRKVLITWHLVNSEFSADYVSMNGSDEEHEQFIIDELEKHVPDIVCQYVDSIKCAVERFAHDNFIRVTSLLRGNIVRIANFHEFEPILGLLKIVSQQDQEYRDACRTFTVAHNSSLAMTGSVANLFHPAIARAKQLATVMNLLPENEREIFKKEHRAYLQRKCSATLKANMFYHPPVALASIEGEQCAAGMKKTQ